jgi:TRAP-type uncharacterized transport system substrate-binding protein
MTPKKEILSPVVMRSRLMLEAASHMVGDPDWGDRQVRIHFREQGGGDWKLCFFASDAPGAVDSVVGGESDIAIVNPGAVLAMAVRGAGPFKKPVPELRAITVLPQFDQLAFGVTARTGLRSLAEIRDKRYPLRLSLRGQRDHSLQLIVDQVLSVMGFSLGDIVAWGGQVRYDQGMPNMPNRMGAVERGEIDAIFDEAVPVWGAQWIDMGMRFLPIDEPSLRKLEAAGHRRVAIAREEYPKLPEDVWTIDFSGWPVFTLANKPDSMITSFCAGLAARKDRIPWFGKGPLRLDLMCKDTREGPLPIPLHPAAERFWKDCGYLG